MIFPFGFMGSAYDPDAQAYINALAADGYPLEAPEQTYINTLVTDFKSAGIWSKMKAIYPYCTSQRNLLNTTTDFSGWSLEGGTLTSGFTDPDGTSTAYKYTAAGGNGLWANQNIPIMSSGNGAILSIWVKSVSGANVTFNLSSGYSAAGMVTHTATNTWQRVTCYYAFAAGGSFYLYSLSDPTNGIYVWHPQLEIGSTATTYQPVATTASTIFASQFKYNLKDPRNLDAAFRQVFNGGWTYSKQGATPNGTNGYADTFLNPRSSLSQFSVHASNYSRTQNSTVSGVQLGAYDSVSNSEVNIFQYYAAVAVKGSSLYAYPLTAVYASNTNTLGFQIGSRTTNNSAKLYFNGSLLNTNTNTETALLPNRTIYLGASNWISGTNQYTPHQHAFDTIGDGLTDSEASAMYTSVQNYQTSMQRQV